MFAIHLMAENTESIPNWLYISTVVTTKRYGWDGHKNFDCLAFLRLHAVI